MLCMCKYTYTFPAICMLHVYTDNNENIKKKRFRNTHILMWDSTYRNLQQYFYYMQYVYSILATSMPYTFNCIDMHVFLLGFHYYTWSGLSSLERCIYMSPISYMCTPTDRYINFIFVIISTVIKAYSGKVFY